MNPASQAGCSRGVTGEDESAWLDQMEWVKPSSSRQAVNEAATDCLRLLNEKTIEEWGDDEWSRYNKNIALIDHWRACHAYPLNALQINLRRMARKFDRTALIAQRTKRLISIWNKLEKHESMKLTQMQDVAGCRAVVANVRAVK
jgi:(p)ppGpp synthase/HD superfamily hydrolase